MLARTGSEQVAILGCVDPDAYASGSTYSTGWVKADKFYSYMAIVMAGDFVSTGKVDGKIEQAQTDGGTPKDVTGAAITQLTQAGTDDNKQAVINFSQDDLDLANGYQYVRLSIPVTTAGADAAGLLLGLNPRYAPASDNDSSAVDEIVTA